MDRAECDVAVVIDSDMDMFPASAVVTAVRAGAGDSVAWTRKTPELLDVQVQQVTGGIVFIAVVRPGRLQRRQTVQAGLLKRRPTVLRLIPSCFAICR